MHRNLDLLGPPAFTDKERQYARKMQSTLSLNDIETAYIQAGISEVRDQVLAESILPSDAQPVGMSGSTDVADVSWVVPTVQLWGANYAIGTPFHSWQMTAQGKSSIAIKGMTHAATAMAATGVDVLLDKKLRENAWLDLKKSVGKKGYVSPLLNNARPPIKDMAP
jgi:Metal-dependent amidase/aminoacylase/carboxypeptidase